MAGRSKRAEQIYTIAEQTILDLGIELIDVVWVREGPSRILRLIIDKKGGVSLDDCTAVSQLVDPLIDQQLQLKDHDFLEVSSPGLDRPLKTDQDLARHLGEWVEVSLYQAWNGKKRFEAKLASSTGEEIWLELADGTSISFKKTQVARIKRTIRF